MTDNTPMRTITASGGVRNCETDSRRRAYNQFHFATS